MAHLNPINTNKQTKCLHLPTDLYSPLEKRLAGLTAGHSVVEPWCSVPANQAPSFWGLIISGAAGCGSCGWGTVLLFRARVPDYCAIARRHAELHFFFSFEFQLIGKVRQLLWKNALVGILLWQIWAIRWAILVVLQPIINLCQLDFQTVNKLEISFDILDMQGLNIATF